MKQFCVWSESAASGESQPTPIVADIVRDPRMHITSHFHGFGRSGHSLWPVGGGVITRDRADWMSWFCGSSGTLTFLPIGLTFYWPFDFISYLLSHFYNVKKDRWLRPKFVLLHCVIACPPLAYMNIFVDCWG